MRKTDKAGVGSEYSLGPLDFVKGLFHMVCADDILGCLYKSTSPV